VGDEDRVFQYAVDFARALFEDRFSGDIFVFDAGDFGDLAGDGHLGIDQPVVGLDAGEPEILVHGELDSTKLDDPVAIERVEAGGLSIESDDAVLGPVHRFRRCVVGRSGARGATR